VFPPRPAGEPMSRIPRTVWIVTLVVAAAFVAWRRMTLNRAAVDEGTITTTPVPSGGTSTITPSDTASNPRDLEESHVSPSESNSVGIRLPARGAEEADPQHASPARPKLVFLVDGEACTAFRVALLEGEDGSIAELHPNEVDERLSQRTEATIALATVPAPGEPPRWSGPVLTTELAQRDHTLHAVPLCAMRGVVVEAGTNDPIEGATLEAHAALDSRWLVWLHGESRLHSTAKSDSDGRFVLHVGTSGTYQLGAASPDHVSKIVQVDVQTDTILSAELDLEPRPTLCVTLVGADGDPAEYFAAHTIRGTRAPFARDWTSAVPLDAAVEFLDIAVGLPGGTEVTTYLSGVAADHPDGVTIDLSAAGLDVTFVGAPIDEQRLLALVFYTLPTGTQVFANRWVVLGETVRIPLGTAGEVCVDAAWMAVDGTPRTLVRRRVEAPSGRVTPVTIELPKRLQRVQLVGADSRAIGIGEVWFAAGDEGQLSTPGGTLDADSSQIVPDVNRTLLWLHGRATADHVPFAGVRFEPHTSDDDLVPIALGAVMRTEVELVPSAGSPLPPEWPVEIVCARTGQMASFYDVPATGRITLSWFEASEAALKLPPDTTWSPREPVPLTAGSLRVPVVRRAWCAIETGGAALIELQHVESGLSLADLERDPTVRREPYSAGERWWGVPAGHYRITLAGDEAPRGPFAVAPGAWVTVLAAGQ
jgi:hypothetical protein